MSSPLLTGKSSLATGMYLSSPPRCAYPIPWWRSGMSRQFASDSLIYCLLASRLESLASPLWVCTLNMILLPSSHSQSACFGVCSSTNLSALRGVLYMCYLRAACFQNVYNFFFLSLCRLDVVCSYTRLHVYYLKLFLFGYVEQSLYFNVTLHLCFFFNPYPLKLQSYQGSDIAWY